MIVIFIIFLPFVSIEILTGSSPSSEPNSGSACKICLKPFNLCLRFDRLLGFGLRSSFQFFLCLSSFSALILRDICVCRSLSSFDFKAPGLLKESVSLYEVAFHLFNSLSLDLPHTDIFGLAELSICFALD